MKVKEMKSILESNKFDNIECNFKLKSKGPQAPQWFKEFAVMVEKRFDQLEYRIDKLESRIDNIVSKNNLTE